jgi:hypothetical protein
MVTNEPNSPGSGASCEANDWACGGKGLLIWAPCFTILRAYYVGVEFPLHIRSKGKFDGMHAKELEAPPEEFNVVFCVFGANRCR